METGWDILFFWVARMILVYNIHDRSKYRLGTCTFMEWLRAEDGKKMSKSRPESIIDPLEVIPKYGTDALRMALIMGVSPGNDQNWGQGKIEANRNFCNKIWNIARYIEGSVDDKLSFSQHPEPKTIADHWVINKINQEIETIAANLDKYRFSEAYERLYHLIWDDVADWYIEASKTAPNASVLSWALETILGLAHSFAPFVTESIWQELGDDSILAQKQWPQTENCDSVAFSQFEEVKKIVTETRHIKATLKLQGGELAHSDSKFIDEHQGLIKNLAKLNKISVEDKSSGLELTQTNEKCRFVIDPGTAKNFLASLKKSHDSNKSKIEALEGRLRNKSYVEKAPEHLVQATKDEIKELESEQKTIKEQITQFESI